MPTATRARSLLVCLHLLVPALAEAEPRKLLQAARQQLKVFLDCQDCFQDFLRSEITFIDYVRDRTEADVHVLVTSTETGGGGREYTIAFTGLSSISKRAIG